MFELLAPSPLPPHAPQKRQTDRQTETERGEDNTLLEREREREKKKKLVLKNRFKKSIQL